MRSILVVAVTLAACSSAPETAAPASDRFEVIPIVDGIYALRDDAHYSLFLITDDGIVVMDPLNDEAATHLVSVLRELAPQAKLAAIVYSHYHADHAGGARPLLDAYGADVPIVANERTAEILAEKRWPEVAAPTVRIDPPWSRRFGQYTLELRHVGPNHSSDMLIGWIPEVKLVMLVDFMSGDSVGYRDLPGVWLPQLWTSMDRVLELPIERAAFGHGRPGTRATVEAHRDYWRKLRVAVLAAIAEGLDEAATVARVALPEYASWRMYDAWFPMNVAGVYRHEKATGAAIRAKMKVHREALGGLGASLEAGDFAAIAALARAIVDTPRLAEEDVRPSAFDTFDTLDKVLRERATALGAAAVAGDRAAVERAWARMSDTCTRCHETLQPGRWGH